jgi:hypothetical protein
VRVPSHAAELRDIDIVAGSMDILRLGILHGNRSLIHVITPGSCSNPCENFCLLRSVSFPQRFLLWQVFS